jgi:hypothetical protein
MSTYRLAVYDFRSKQDYIYRTNKVQEIMGASELIKNAYQAALHAYSGKYDPGNALFSLQSFGEAAVLYEGGGNLALLFQSEDAMHAFNKHFSWWLIEHMPGLQLLCGCTAMEENEAFHTTLKRALTDMGAYRQLLPPNIEATVLPITQIDRGTSQSVVWKGIDPDQQEVSLSAESLCKRNAYDDHWYVKEENDNRITRIFDDIVPEKGRESLLAVLYVDGNNIGEFVKNYMHADTGFETGVNKQRALTQKIQAAFVDEPLAKIKSRLQEKDALMRQIIGGGDEITIVCNARFALDVADA